MAVKVRVENLFRPRGTGGLGFDGALQHVERVDRREFAVCDSTHCLMKRNGCAISLVIHGTCSVKTAEGLAAVEVAANRVDRGEKVLAWHCDDDPSMGAEISAPWTPTSR